MVRDVTCNTDYSTILLGYVNNSLMRIWEIEVITVHFRRYQQHHYADGTGIREVRDDQQAFPVPSPEPTRRRAPGRRHLALLAGPYRTAAAWLGRLRARGCQHQVHSKQN